MQGAQVEVEVTGVAHGGVFVARHEGRVIFVSDAIPGERVLVEVSDDSKPSFWRADTVAVLSSSEHRREHVWSAASLDRAPFDRAGGVDFGHIALDYQRELKRQVLVDALSRMARIDSDVTVEALPSGRGIPGASGVGPEVRSAGVASGDDTADFGAEGASGNRSPARGPDGADGVSVLEAESDGTGWRTRIRLHVAEDGTTGPYAARSHRVIRVDDLPLAVPEAQAVAPLDERFDGAEHVDVVVPSTGNPFVLVDRGDGARPKKQRIVERVGDRNFVLDARGFWQVHRHAAATLTTAVQNAVADGSVDPDASNLDLYGGVGLLAAALGDIVGANLRITTVESDSLATQHASENLRDWAGATAVTDRVDRFLRHLRMSGGAVERERLTRGTVILDPPRSGAGKAVVNELAELNPAQVVYVACDPVALARDVSLFAAHGYALTRLRAFDLFPNTHHVEAVATLIRG